MLVADVHAHSRRGLVRLLEMKGYRALAVEDRRRALAFFETFRPNLIFWTSVCRALYRELDPGERLAGLCMDKTDYLHKKLPLALEMGE